MRVFVGMRVDEEGRRGIKKIVKQLKRGHWPVRWEEEDKWHVTAAFLGEIEKGKVRGAVRAVERGVREVRPFEVGFKGLGAFGDLVLPKIVWVSLRGDLKSMARLVKRVRKELGEEGLEVEVKGFMPHVSLGRVKRDCSRKQRLELGKYLRKHLRMGIEQRWRVDRVGIYESQLKPEGAEHRLIKEIKLEE